MAADSIQSIGRELAEALVPLRRMVATRHGLVRLLDLLGYMPPPGVESFGLDKLDVTPIVKALSKLELSAGVKAEGSSIEVVIYAEVLTALQNMLRDFGQLEQTFQEQLPAEYLAKTRMHKRLPRQLLDLLVMTHVRASWEPLYDLLLLVGIFRFEPQAADPGNFRTSHTGCVIAYDRISTLLGNPSVLLQGLGWGTGGFNATLMLLLVGQVLRPLASNVHLRRLPRRVEERLRGVAAPEADIEPLPQLLVSFVKGLDWSALDVGFTAFGLRPSAPGATDAGIGIAPLVRRTKERSFALAKRLGLSLDTDLDVQSGVVVALRPGRAPTIQTGVTSGAAIGPAAGHLLFRLAYQPRDGESIALLRLPSGTRLEGREVAVSAGVRSVSASVSEFVVELELKGVRFVLSIDEGSALLTTLIPKDAVRADFDLAIGWAAGRAYLRGSADLQTSFPVNLSIGPVDLQSVTVGLAPNAGKLPIEVSATLETTLGPLTLTIERVGLTAAFDFPGDASGNLGPLNVDLGFKVPTGIGLALDAGPITGGGFLSLDPTGQRYGGVLQLKLPIASVVAFGIYEQVQGQASFVAVLGIRFNPGVQLSFGFALTGVGGLVGLNRRANVDVLRDRLASGAAGNVLFCEDPVKNAPTILGDLAAFFPAASNGFLVGPTLQISWLSPIVRLDIGILIEFPGPSKIIILGSIRAIIGLGDSLALLFLRMDVLGIIDFEQQLISIDAALVNSHALGIIRLTGGMAFRLSYGNNPYILMSVGGFHPRFDPGPLNIPRLARIGASLDVSVLVKIYVRVELYVAFTSNTLQVGSRVEAGMDIGPLGVHGYYGFDALIQFRPFYFDLEYSAGFDVEVFGTSFCSVSIVGRISGPGPIVIYARGSVKLLFVRVSASATFELGEKNGDTLTPIASPVRELAPELRQRANLRTEGDDPTIVRRPGRPAVEGALVSPMGSLIWEQKRAPLRTIIHRMGGVPLDGPHELHLDAPAKWTTADERDWFNPGGFTNFDLQASQTLNNATFQEMASGLRMGSAVDAQAGVSVNYLDEIDLVKRPAKDRFSLQVGAYLTKPLHAMLRERTTTPPVDPGPPKVAVRAETADVHAADGTRLHRELVPFQAFQLARQDDGRVAVPTTDVTVDL